MPRFESPLNHVRIASPCSANWDDMFGNDRVRFCGQCKLNVYNLSGMSREEAENLITNAEDRLCVRFYRRLDGTVITENCPVGWAKVKQRAKVTLTATFSFLLSLWGALFAVAVFSKPGRADRVDILTVATPTPAPLMGYIAPNRNTAAMGDVSYSSVMGNVAATPIVRKSEQRP
jgi:hypothetical protein